jgi:excisionase family DNA binding protein
MAGMFYSLHEAAEKLNISEEQLKELAQEGKLREFRDGPNSLFKVDEVEALIPEVEAAEAEVPELEVTEPEAPEPEAAAAEPQPEEEEALEFDLSGEDVPEQEETPEPQAEEEEPIELDLSDTETPEQEETPEPEMAEPEPQADQAEAVELDLSDTEVPQEQAPEPEARTSEPQGLEPPDAEAPEPEVSEEEVPSPEALEAEMEGLEEPEFEIPEEEELVPGAEAPQPSESAADSDEILLAPETGSPLSSDLTDADTALTGLGTSVLGETDRDYALTDDTMGETALPKSPTGTTPEVPLEEIEEDVNLDTFGSGSGLLDLSLQADDTSLGGILDEIYTAEEEGKDLGEVEGGSAAAMAAEAEQMAPEVGLAGPQAVPEVTTLAGPMIEVAPDTQSNTLGMLLFLPLVIVIYTLVVAVAGQRHVMPTILASIQAFIWYIMGGAAVLAGIVVVAAFMLGGERGSAAPKVKKAKVKKEKPPKEAKKPKEKKVKEPKKAKKGFLRLK